MLDGQGGAFTFALPGGAFSSAAKPYQVAPWASFVVQVRFAPQAGQAYASMFRVSVNGEEDVLERPVTGRGPLPPAVVLTAPGNGAVAQPLRPTFTWEAAQGATSYAIDLAETSDFATGETALFGAPCSGATGKALMRIIWP